LKTLSRQKAQGSERASQRPNYKEQIGLPTIQNQMLQARAMPSLTISPSHEAQLVAIWCLRKTSRLMRGQQHLFDTQKYFYTFPIEIRRRFPRVEYSHGNQRSTKEHIRPGKACGVGQRRSIRWKQLAYMVMASLPGR